jgi:hypothetical protein
MAAFGVWLSFMLRDRALSRGKGDQPRPAPVSTAPVSRPADPVIPAPAEVPKSVQPAPAQQIPKDAAPLPASVPAKSADKELKSAPPAVSEAERRRAALRALEQGTARSGEADPKERERRRIEALKALQK